MSRVSALRCCNPQRWNSYNTDPIGVELAGALKNVFAIASGVASGLEFESNTRAGLVTRSLAEMTRIGVAFGADPLTCVLAHDFKRLMMLTRAAGSKLLVASWFVIPYV